MNLNRKLDIYHVRHIFTYHESCADCAVRQPQKEKKREKKSSRRALWFRQHIRIATRSSGHGSTPSKKRQQAVSNGSFLACKNRR
jgi:hypothetical protein